MYRIAVIFLLCLILSNCGAKIESVVDRSVTDKTYENPLIVIFYKAYSTKNFTKKLKDKLEIEFTNDNQKVAFLLFEQKKDKLELNKSDDINADITQAVQRNQNDIVMIFRPIKLSYYNGGLNSATYELTGIDVLTKKEVWKAKLNSNSSFGPALFAEKSAQLIYEKLKSDKILTYKPQAVSENPDLIYKIIDESEIIAYEDAENPPLAPGYKSKWDTEKKRKYFKTFVAKHINKNYDTGLASRLGLTGTTKINIECIIDTDGNPVNISASGGPEVMNAHAVEIMSQLPQSIPAMQNAKSVPVQFKTSVTFIVQD